jgi:hypothetical protein
LDGRVDVAGCLQYRWDQLFTLSGFVGDVRVAQYVGDAQEREFQRRVGSESDAQRYWTMY